ncbi:MAG: class I SAM-dependent methyltransferase [Actinobacteria bacterium]|nr:class I SAM-dependent methyltransferase [Chloroflexota bacterium]MBE3128729.1 class I SAM-dependent methyltransferase [Actinomycetota bacterium]
MLKKIIKKILGNTLYNFFKKAYYKLKDIISKIKAKINQIIGIFLYKFISKSKVSKLILPVRKLPKDMDENFEEIYHKCKEFTSTSIEKMFALYKAVEYIVNSGIKGDFVECGVWQGGSQMIVAYTLLKMDVSDRKIYLYDTFTGMAEPTSKDRSFFKSSEQIRKVWQKHQKNEYNIWCLSMLDEVKNNMFSTGYPKDNIIFVNGMVEDTIPKIIPKKISLLRLDTDWYKSTYHELTHLYPLLSKGGVLLIDDYGCWMGQKDAVDQYFKENNIKMLLNRIGDEYIIVSGGRIGIKTD